MGYYMSFPQGRKKALTLSYDDGVRQDRKLIKILDKYGIKATFNINSGCFSEETDFDGEQGRMSAEEVKALFENSHHELAIHGLAHEFDDLLHSNMMANEILEDRKNLEKLSGRIIRGMAYPFGTFNDKLVDCLKACGIVYSRTVISSQGFSMPVDWLRLQATCHHANEKLFDLCETFLKPSRYGYPQMFYLWGHSYEFDNNVPNNNWELIEKFAELMGGREEIWYATNIEIYDYTKAYENLQFSTDGCYVYNPSAIEVWFSDGMFFNGSVMSVKPGEMLKIK